MAWISNFQYYLGVIDRDVQCEELCYAFSDLDQNFVRLLYNSYEGSNNDRVRLQVILTGLRVYYALPPIHKLLLLFKILDDEGSGLIDIQSLEKTLRLWSSSFDIQLPSEKIELVTKSLFDAVNTESEEEMVGFIEIADELQIHQDLVDVLTGKTPSLEVPTAVVAPKAVSRRRRCFRYVSKPYLIHNQRKIYSVCIYLIASVLVFLWGAWSHVDSGQLLAVARGCGACLNLNCAFVVVFMLRYTSTRLRTTPLGKILPLDHGLFLHKMVAFMIGFYSVMHAIFHVLNVVYNCAKDCTFTHTLEYLFTTKAGVGYFYKTAYITGWFALCVYFVILTTSLNFCIQKYHSIFTTCHLLYIPFLVTTILHGPNFWKWLLVPGLLFAIERVISCRFVKHIRFGNTHIREAHLLPNGVVHLVIERPKRLKFQPGDYIFLQLPALSTNEWHPFTISSAPENEETISLHVRSLGDWTRQLFNFFHKDQLERDAVVHEIVSPTNPKKERGKQEDGFSYEIQRKICKGSDINTIDGKITLPPLITSRDSPRLSRGVTIKIPLTPRPRIEESGKPSSDAGCSDNDLIVDCEIDDNDDLKKSVKKGKARLISNRRKLMMNSIATQTSIDIEDNWINVVSTTSNDESLLQVYVDGPYGTCTRRIFEADHVVLIATGIGITPFASILQSLMYRFQKVEQRCPNCYHSWMEGMPKAIMRLKKVDFIWINREQRNFEWFASLLSDLENAGQSHFQFSRFLTMQLYLTSQPEPGSLNDLALQTALDRIGRRDSRDLLTGLKTRTQYGRPNWDKVFKEIAIQRIGKVKVFFCGPPKMTKILKRKCEQHDFLFRREIFS